MLRRFSLWMVVFCVVVGALSAIQPALKAQEEASLCCNYSTNCADQLICCNPEKVGAYNCSENLNIGKGYCRPSC